MIKNLKKTQNFFLTKFKRLLKYRQYLGDKFLERNKNYSIILKYSRLGNREENFFTVNAQKDYKKIENKEPSEYFIMGQNTMENGLSGQI